MPEQDGEIYLTYRRVVDKAEHSSAVCCHTWIERQTQQHAAVRPLEHMHHNPISVRVDSATQAYSGQCHHEPQPSYTQWRSWRSRSDFHFAAESVSILDACATIGVDLEFTSILTFEQCMACDVIGEAGGLKIGIHPQAMHGRGILAYSVSFHHASDVSTSMDGVFSATATPCGAVKVCRLTARVSKVWDKL